MVIHNFYFKGDFKVFRVLDFAFKVCGTHFDNGVHRIVFRYCRIALDFRVFNGPLGSSGAEFALLFRAVDGLVSPLALFKFRIDDHFGFKGQLFRMGVLSVGHGTDSDDLIFGIFCFFYNRFLTTNNFSIFDTSFGSGYCFTIFSGLVNYFFSGF